MPSPKEIAESLKHGARVLLGNTPNEFPPLPPRCVPGPWQGKSSEGCVEGRRIDRHAPGDPDGRKYPDHYQWRRTDLGRAVAAELEKLPC